MPLYSEELEVDGIVEYSSQENLWVAVIDWDKIREMDDLNVKESTAISMKFC